MVSSSHSNGQIKLLVQSVHRVDSQRADELSASCSPVADNVVDIALAGRGSRLIDVGQGVVLAHVITATDRQRRPVE